MIFLHFFVTKKKKKSLTYIINQKIESGCKKRNPRECQLWGFLYYEMGLISQYYHLIIALAQVNPLPKAAKTTVSPDLIFPFSQASVKAIGIEAAVVFPYF